MVGGFRKRRFPSLGFKDEGDLQPGEAVFITLDGKIHRKQCALKHKLRPCIFEYIYLARPDSVLDGVLVYEARLNMGRRLAEKIRRDYPELSIDCVVPVPDSGRVAAMELAHECACLIVKRWLKTDTAVAVLLSPEKRRAAARCAKKLNVIGPEFSGKKVLLVDDSIVRGTTGQELVYLAREAGARQVYLASAAPPVRYPNVYALI